MTRIFVLTMFLVACHKGDFDETCNPDGTCNAPALVCAHWGRCATKIAPPPTRPECRGDADCFCHDCLKRCGDAGVRLCAYTDTTVWGSKPTTCECR